MTQCHPEQHVIRTSDRAQFRKCRQFWDFTSKIRMDYEPKVKPHYFDFGSAIHEGLDVFYQPETWHWPTDVRVRLAQKAFSDMCAMHKKRHMEAVGGALSEEEQADHDERFDLGMGMLEHYGPWSATNDRFTPVLSEIEFEVPVVVPGTTKQLMMPCIECDELLPVVYQGRIDLIVELWDEPDTYWILDHKTTQRMESTEHVELDPQISSYVWAARRHLQLPVGGFSYSELYKGYPDKPKVNQQQRQGRWLSVNKAQSTTYELYLQAIEEMNEPIELYEDILRYLKASGPEFVRRTDVHRTDKELDYVEEKVYEESVDMLGDPFIYPNASRWNCRGCVFRDPCLARHDGSDVQFLLDQSGMYEKRN